MIFLVTTSETQGKYQHNFIVLAEHGENEYEKEALELSDNNIQVLTVPSGF